MFLLQAFVAFLPSFHLVILCLFISFPFLCYWICLFGFFCTFLQLHLQRVFPVSAAYKQSYKFPRMICFAFSVLSDFEICNIFSSFPCLSLTLSFSRSVRAFASTGFAGSFTVYLSKVDTHEWSLKCLASVLNGYAHALCIHKYTYVHMYVCITVRAQYLRRDIACQSSRNRWISASQTMFATFAMLAQMLFGSY